MADADAVVPTGLLQPRLRTAVIVASVVLGVVVARNLFVAAHQVLGWTVAAAVVAIFISPAIRTLGVVLPRPVAVAISFVLVIVAVVAIGWIYTNGVQTEMERLREEAPAIAQEIEERDDRIGTLASDIGLADQVSQVTDRLAERVGSSGDALRSAALSAPPYLITLILTIFFLIFGPRVVAAGLDRLPGSDRWNLHAAVPEATRRAQIYVGAALAQAVVSGLGAFVVASLLGAPGAGLVAIVAAVAALLPYLGIVVGWFPLLVLGLGLVPLYQVAMVAVVMFALQAVEALVWRRFVDSRSLHLGPAIPLFVAVLANAVYGLGAALCACGIAVLVVALADQLAPGTPLPTPVDDES